MFSRAGASADLAGRFASLFATLGSDASAAGAAAWSLVHGLASLILEGRLEDSQVFVRKVLGAMRFAAGPRSGA
jgi:hypothetical protein